METVYSENHRLHAPQAELSGGKWVRPFENPLRAERILARIRESRLGAVIPPREFGPGPVHRVHPPAFTAVLERAWRDWAEAGFEGDALPLVWPVERASRTPPRTIDARLGEIAFAADTAITAGTWTAVRAAADTVLTAEERVAGGDRACFALCRPPGHHAASNLYGGYCFLNNAAIAAQSCLDRGSGRVAILDIDFHHGNGTQSIFYDRADVLYLSLHGDPADAFPYYWGYADETGSGKGEGYTVNYPLPAGTSYDAYREALDAACRRLADAKPDVLVVSLGVDTYRGDPISSFALESEDYLDCGARLGRLRLPTLFVMEGGYAVEEIGINTVNVLVGFEDAAGA